MVPIHPGRAPQFAGIKLAYIESSPLRLEINGKRFWDKHSLGFYVDGEDRAKFQELSVPVDGEAKDLVSFETRALNETVIIKNLPWSDLSPTKIPHHFRPTAGGYRLLNELVSGLKSINSKWQAEILEQLRMGAIRTRFNLQAEAQIAQPESMETVCDALNSVDPGNTELKHYA
jgi:hypothetical protein